MLRTLAAAAFMFCAAQTALSAYAQRDPAQQIEGIAAVVNDQPISFSDVRQRARMLLLSLGGQSPTQEQIVQIAAQALEQLIDEKLQLQEAAEYEVEVSDSDIANSIESLARQSGIDRETLLNTLLTAGISPSSLESQTRADIGWRRIMGGLYGSRIRISDNQINDQINRLKVSAQREQFQMSEIFLYAPDPTERDQATTAAESIRQQILGGAPFQAAAQRFSSAPTAATGGDMGWMTLEDMDEARRNAVKALEGPGLTPPIGVEDGVYILQVKARRAPSERTSKVDLIRVTVKDGSEASLKNAITGVSGCEGLRTASAGNANLTLAELKDLNVAELGPEGKTMVMATAVGQHTDIFAASGSLAVMFVCSRQDNVDDVPSRDQIEDRLYSEQLGMISQRSLRNLRREATIIRR